MSGEFVQGLVTNWVSEAIKVGVMAAVAIAFTYIRKLDPRWGTRARFALTVFVLLAILYFTFTGRAVLSEAPQPVTSENIEQLVKSWADSAGVGLERQDNSQDSDFSYIMRLHGGDPVEIFKPKSKREYIEFQATITFAPEHEASLAALNQAGRERVERQIEIELLRSGASTIRISGPAPHTSVLIQRGVRITTLTNDLFLATFDQTTREVELARAVIRLSLEGHEDKIVKPRPVPSQ